MRVYHGSHVGINHIDLSLCLPNKDFGQGFYVTKFRRHAEDWAKIIGQRNGTQGVVTEFLFYDSPFTERLCKVKHFAGYNEEWLDFIIRGRNPMEPMHDFDIVEGPIADDKVQFRIFDFLAGKVGKLTFLEELKHHEETHQICFCTLKSLLTLKTIGETPTSEIAHINDAILERLMIDNELDEKEAADLFYDSETFSLLANGNMKLHEKSWEDIYMMLKKELHP